ncbi:hypothetical protein [Desulfohalovibrio reitneri]|uniref:hypothetical protein n=1 Tax=Desulfohalovibrio reitneri TaxID=1307759 RepID=UPI0004A6BB0C|nr:hypothetical protein [Desulfohalovibrio reitneri]
MRIDSHGYTPYDDAVSRFRAQELGQNARQQRDQAQARVTTTQVGFNLGKLGVRYRSEDMRLDHEAMDRQAEQQEHRRQARSFGQAMEEAVLRARSAQPPPDQAGDLSSLTTMRQGLAAYAKATYAGPSQPTPRPSLGTV